MCLHVRKNGAFSSLNFVPHACTATYKRGSHVCTFAMAKRGKCADGPVENESRFKEIARAEGEFKHEMLQLVVKNLPIGPHRYKASLVCMRFSTVLSLESFNMVMTHGITVIAMETWQFKGKTLILVATKNRYVQLYIHGQSNMVCSMYSLRTVNSLNVISQKTNGFVLAATYASLNDEFPFDVIWVSPQNDSAQRSEEVKWTLKILGITTKNGVNVDYTGKDMYEILPLRDTKSGTWFLERHNGGVGMIHMDFYDMEANIKTYTRLRRYNNYHTGFIHTYSSPRIFGVLCNVSIVGSHEHPYELLQWNGEEYIQLELPTLCDDNERRDVFERTHTQLTAYKNVLLSGVESHQRWDVNTHIPPRSNGFSTYPSHLRVYAILHGRLYCVDNGPSTAVGTKCSFLRKVNDDGWFESVYEKVVVLCKPKTGNAYCVRVLTCT